MKLLPSSHPARVSIALVLGLSIGIAISMSASPTLRLVASAIEPIGTIWVNAIRMTVIPLVFSLLVTAIAGERDIGAVGRLGTHALVIFTIMLTGVAVLGVLGGPPLFSLLTIDSASATTLRGSAVPGTADVQLPTFASWLTSLVPSNPIAAAADGAMLPLVVFVVLFAAALTRTPPDLRVAATSLFRGIANAMLVLIGWVLAAAPIGVFALSLTLAIRVGVGVAGAVGFYFVVHCGLITVAIALVYVIVRLFGGMPLSQFARAVLPAQLVAVSTRSSFAALPAMIDGAERFLKLPTSITSFALPFGVSLFRLNQGISWVVCALFIGKLYGVHLGVGQIALLAAMSVPMSFTIPGIPSGSLFIIAPFFMTVGLPIEGVGILIALDLIPDVFKTSLVVTGHMAATVLLARGRSAEPLEAAIVTPATLRSTS